MSANDQKLLRIGVFYDGGFFYHVSNYYKYSHDRKRRISIPGLHNFIRHHAAQVENVDVRYSQIVDAHFFRGRFSAQKTKENEKLFAERAFDDVLMNEGVTTHYLPIPGKTEKGIDVWLSLEAFELALYKRYNILALIAGDSDFVPLVRKVNSIGSRVMVLGWDFEYTDDLGSLRQTVTSTRLLNEVTHPVAMHEIIDNKTQRNTSLVNDLFIESSYSSPSVPSNSSRHNATFDSSSALKDDTSKEKKQGTVISIKEGFGFLKSEDYPNNVFVHNSSLVNRDFSQLSVGDTVRFFAIEGEKGHIAQEVEVL